VGREGGGRVWGTFGIALEMSLRKIRNKKNGELKKKKEKEYKSQKEWRTPRKQSPLNQYEQSSCGDNIHRTSGVWNRSSVCMLWLPV
jgi:predicted sugar kinase